MSRQMNEFKADNRALGGGGGIGRLLEALLAAKQI